jgi:16S rRNA (uracil1498-N3)-methyltransferase
LTRIYCPNFFINNSTESINDSSIIHRLNNVLRIKPGEKIEIFNKEGKIFYVEIEKSTEKKIEVKIINVYAERQEESSEIILAVAFPKGKRGEWIIEKATEIGVKKIIILQTDRSIMKPGEGRINKWRQIALHASEQSKRTEVPEINFGNINSIKGIKIAAILGSRLSIKETLEERQEIPKTITYIVGPEGDWTEEEKKDLLETGANPVTLGSTTLRVETAALYGVAVISEWIKKNTKKSKEY